MKRSNQIFPGDIDIPENQTTDPAASGSHQPVIVFGGDTRTPFHQKGTEAFILVGRIVEVGTAIHQEDVGFRCADNKTLLPFQDKVISFEIRTGHGTKKIGPASRFRERFGTDHFALEYRLQIFFLLLRGTEYA